MTYADELAGNDSGRSLAELESVVERGIAGWIDAALAWKEIRDGRLWHVDRGGVYRDFDTYSRERWGKRRETIDQIIRSAITAQDVNAIALTPPESEGQARELSRVEPERRAEVWQTAVETYGEQPTAAQIRQTASPPMLAIVDLETGEIVEDEPEPPFDLDTGRLRDGTMLRSPAAQADYERAKLAAAFWRLAVRFREGLLALDPNLVAQALPPEDETLARQLGADAERWFARALAGFDQGWRVIGGQQS
jgi:hypothetical protein